MQLYNSATHKKEEFVPHVPGKVSMYTCGPTVYHFAHIGNLRTYMMEDVLEKYLRYAGYDVTRVMNITDVGHLSSDADEGEDKMLKGARREKKTVMEIAKFFTDIRGELKKVVWPSREDVKNNTLVVLAVVAIAVVSLIVLDTAFGGVMRLIVGA